MKQYLENLTRVIMLLLVAGCATDKTELTIEKSPLADFSGSWELDHNLTESPRDKLRWLYDVTRSQLEQQQRQEKQAQVFLRIRHRMAGKTGNWPPRCSFTVKVAIKRKGWCNQ